MDQQSNDSAASDYRLSRRELFPLVGAAALTTALVPASPASAQEQQAPDDTEAPDRPDLRAPRRFVYVGTYTRPNTAPGGVTPSLALGIYVFKMDGRAGGLELVQVVEDTPPGQPLPNPSWLTLDPRQRYLYATSEVSSWRGAPNTGGVTAFSVDGATGKLTRLNDQPSAGEIPAVVTPDPTGRYVLIGNYVGVPPKGTFAVLPIVQAGPRAGQLDPATDVFAVTGTGPNRSRQEQPHPHDVVFDPAGRFVLGPDLGTDRIWAWQLDTGAGKLVPVAPPDPPYAQVASGSGPRHLAFHPGGRFVYVIDELVSSITAFSYDGTHGTLTWIQTVSTLPPNFTGTSACAEIVVHPSGSFVYGSNRGHDSIVGFAIDQQSGKLTLIGWTPTGGSFPRNFNIDPSGSLLLAANQNSDNIVPFSINQRTGRLRPTRQVTQTPTPVCIVFGGLVPEGRP
jgi:6-phosphogluconolactonase